MSDDIELGLRHFRWYVRRVSEGVHRPRRAAVRYACPCCGYPTLLERGAYDICHLCNWEDDGQDDPHADEVWGGPNGAYSLSEARENFKRYLIMYSPEKGDPRVGGPDNPRQEQAKREMIEAFDKMASEADRARLDELWQQVFKSERVLEREMRRKLRR